MTYKLSDICDFVKGKVPVATLTKHNYISTENMLPNRGGIVEAATLPTTDGTQSYSVGDILVSNIRPYFKKIWFATQDGGCSNDVLVFRAKKDTNPIYLYYVLADDRFFNYATATSKGTKMPRGDKVAIMNYEITEFSKEEQDRIASLLHPIDKKIALNNQINNNLLEQVMAIYRNRFVDTTNDMRRNCRADEYFSISIGKTPPRKEPQWFTEEQGNVTWVSISDMGDCGTFISDSSEYLTAEAVQNFNVQIVPDHTVLLSFKLTVGRVAITVGEMTTNEAIAHFKTSHQDITEYLYCYLKAFNYQSLGSTSSIATAVNSKIIKAMPFIVPTDDEITDFHGVAAPIFEKIKANQSENLALVSLREALLPRLMSGELDVSEIVI